MKIKLKMGKFKFIVLTTIFAAISIGVNSQTLQDALKLLTSERYEDATDVLKKVIEKEPNNGDAYFYLGETVLRNYQSDPYSNTLEEIVKEAKGIFEKGLKADSTNVLNSIGLGMVCLLAKDDTVTADNYFRKAESVIPKKSKKFTDRDYTILIKLGIAQLYSSKPRFNKAIAYLERARTASVETAKQPNMEKPEVYIALGDVYLEQNNASEAVKNYNRAMYINPGLAEPIVKIGRLYMRSRNLQEARNYFDRAKEIDSTYAPLYRAYGELYSMSSATANFAKINFRKFLELSGNNLPAKVQYVNSLFKAKDYKECLLNIEEIFEYDKSRNYLNRIAAYSAYEMRPPDYEKALRYIEEFFKNATPEKIIPKDYLYYGRILIKQKDEESINKGFEQLMIAYKLDTTDIELINDIAYNAYYTKRFQLAIDMLNKKIALGKAQSSDYMVLGKAHYQYAQSMSDTMLQNAEYRNAEKVFEKLTQLEPDNVQAYYWIANTNFSLDPDNKQGLALPKYQLVIEKGLADTVKNANELFEAYKFMGSYYLFSEKPDYDKAESYFVKMLYLDPKKNQWKVQGYSSLAFLYTKKAKYQDAIAMYKKILELEPNNDNAKKGIEALNKRLKSQQ